jgi:polysaccharide export outer membrane protein
VAAIKVSDIIDATDPSQNIPILPGDSISVPKADLVYVVGSVIKAGGFALNEHSSISALQLISLAEGLQKTAAADHARILRTVPGSNDRSEIALNLKKLMSGKNADIQLKPNDILFVPNSSAKVAEQRTIDILVSTVGVAIWRF